MIKDIRSGKRDIEPVNWPGTDNCVNLMLLRCDEIQAAHFAAVDWFDKKRQQSDGISLVEFLREKERQEVLRMLLQPGSLNPDDRIFFSADEIRKETHLDEIGYFQGEHERRVKEKLAAWKAREG